MDAWRACAARASHTRGPRRYAGGVRGWTAALLAVLPGCYLSHVLEGPDDEPLPAPAPPRCPAVAHAAGVFVPALEGAESNDVAELAVAGCEHVHALAARAPFSWLTSHDDGASLRAVDLAFGALPELAVATDADGGAHVVIAQDGAIVHRAVSPEDVVGPESTLGGQGAATLSSGPWPRPHHVAAARADGALAVVWSEPRFEALHLGWRGRDGEIEPPAPVVVAGAGERVQEARLCFAGDRLVIAWEQLTDCNTAEVFGAVLDGPGEVLPRRLGTSRATCSTAGGLDVGCSADGRALVVFAESEGEYPRGRGTMGVAVLEGGRLEPHAAIEAPLWRAPVYPSVHAGASRALVTFGGLGYGAAYVVVGFDGSRSAVRELQPSEAGAERLEGAMGGCGHPDRDDFFLVVFERRARSSRELDVIAGVRLDEAGTPLEHARLLESPWAIGPRVMNVACTGGGTLLVDAIGMVGWSPR